MALSFVPPRIILPLHHPPHLSRPPHFPSNGNTPLFFLLLSKPSSLLSSFTAKYSHAVRASSDAGGGVGDGGSGLLDEELLRKVSAAKDADQVLDLIAEEKREVGCVGGTVGTDDCCRIIGAALERDNADLALSIYSAMRSAFVRGQSNNGSSVERWKWSRPDVCTHALLIQGLASSLRVSDANKMIGYVSRVGVSPGDEVSFGKVVRCPTCMVAIAVAQPQQGIQVASCSKCRYTYELVSGDIVSIDSEEVSMEISAWEKGLRFLQKKSIPAAIHSIVVRTPTGTAWTHRFATKTVELPAQEGERVTIASATPSDVSREIGPLKFNARSPDFRPGEPLCLTNHINGQESQLLRALSKDGNSFLLSLSVLFPALALLASGDAASGFFDPSFPRLISIAAVASVTLGATVNSFVLPRLNQLPQRIADAVALRQQLLSQYDMLQIRIRELIQAAEKEVWMLARLCQLEKKIVAVGEPSYRARRSRIKRVRENLENSLMGRIELLESYARISSMIEIEVEMDSNVLAAEAESNAESISEQIEQIMEIENLEERWRIQAEANDEVERLLSSQPLSTEYV